MMASQSQILRLVQNSSRCSLLRNGNSRNKRHVSSTNQTRASVYNATEIQREDPTHQTPLSIATRLQKVAIDNSLQAIKRVSYRLAQLDPLKLNKMETLNELISKDTSLILDELRQSNQLVETQGLLVSSEEKLPIDRIIETIFNYYFEQQCGLEYGHLTNQTEIDWLTNEWEQLNASFSLTREQEVDVAKLLLKCEQFDHFMGAKFPTTKRYGCEGAESMLIVFDELLRLSQTQTTPPKSNGTNPVKFKRITDVLIAMPHRGRLNLLTCLLGLNPAIIFNKCQGEPELDLSEAWMACGDVLSHLSLNTRFVYGVDRHHLGLYRESPDPLNLSLLPNPSHLEVGSPMVMGAARGRAHNLRYGYSSSPKFNVQPKKITTPSNSQKNPMGQEDSADSQFTLDAGYSQHLGHVLSIQVHGDASLAGQGIIQESLQMSNLEQFSVNGSIHLVVNNQIGYTTPSSMGRSSRHCTDVFKTIEAPIIHINGENISTVLKTTRLAYNYRQRFGKDIALNLICFRRHGHNEMDEPSFTQPVMYNNIRNRKSIPETYCDTIQLEDVVKKQLVTNYKTILQEFFKKKDQEKPNNDDYRNFSLPTEYHRDHLISWRTGCDEKLLRQVGLASVDYPKEMAGSEPSDGSQNIKVHPTLERTLIADRQTKFAKQLDPSIDWATAEMLAIGSLLRQNHSVRIAGQDVARGTFSTRHAVLFDQTTERPYVPLNCMGLPAGGVSSTRNETDLHPEFDDVTQDSKLEVANSILSEEAALAYEFGYSIETCELTLWEAQFGDFFNTAQSIIDTLVCSSEAKWLRQSALTLLLPHGLDGAGPEHSSSRLERFLQLSKSRTDSIDTDATVNWSICFPTLPSQYFHLLRRQVLRPFRKPLVVMSPKSIFRHPQCASPLSDFGKDQTFQPVLDDPSMKDEARRKNINTIVLCSGKIFFQLDEIRKSANGALSNVALIRLEELCPFPVQMLNRLIHHYPNVKLNGDSDSSGLVWFQEEHQNQGAYDFVKTRLASLLKLDQLNYIGREVSELPATGSSSLHKRESARLIEQFKSLGQKS